MQDTRSRVPEIVGPAGLARIERAIGADLARLREAIALRFEKNT